MAYALDVLEARGDLDPDSPEAEAFVEAYLKDVTMHEVGHTLGLRHNFRSSRAYTLKQLADPAFTRENGITGSVMEYAPINLNAPDEPRAALRHAVQRHPRSLRLLGDRVRLQAAARRPAARPRRRRRWRRSPARSAEPQLAYGTDEDNFLGIDPESLQIDLGNDAIGFAKKRIAIAQDLLKRQEARQLRPDQDYNLLQALGQLRDPRRRPGGQRAVAPDRRRAHGARRARHRPRPARRRCRWPTSARRSTSSPAACSRPTACASRRRCSASSAPTSASAATRCAAAKARPRPTTRPPSRCSACSARCSAVLMSDTVATRLLESSEKAPAGTGRALRMPELYGRLSQAVWSELDGSGDIAPLRREVQRDHVNRISAMLLRPGASSRADTRSIVRAQAKVAARADPRRQPAAAA